MYKGIQYPYTLLLLICIPAVIRLKRGRFPKTGFSAVSLIVGELEPGFVKKHGLDFLSAMAMVCLILALANIRYSSFFETTHLESRWIMIVQDMSGSMNRPGSEDGDLTLGDIALEGSNAFVKMRHEDDLIGLVAFSSYAKLVSPPTFDKKILKEKLQLLSRQSDSILFRELAAGGATNASYAVWLALCGFFMLLPEDHQPSFEELRDFRHALLGETLRRVHLPEKLRRAAFGQGMAVVLFTDGRIEANLGDADVRNGLPNFINVVELLKRLGVRLYLIVVGGGVNAQVKAAMEDSEEGKTVGRIFLMPDRFGPEKMKAVYEAIHEMEKNRLLVRISERKRETRPMFTWVAMGLLMACSFLKVTPWFRKI